MRRFLAAVAVLAACGGDDDGGPIEIDDLGGALVSAYCSVYVGCGLIDDYATCSSLDLDVEIDADLVAAVKAGTIVYHEDLAGQCLGGIGGSSCERNRLFDEPAACEQVFEGTVAAGGQCAIDEQCISHQCDVPACPDQCCQGTCIGDAPTPRPVLGESCATSTRCVESFCHQDTLVCTAYLALGATCNDTDECLTGVCNGVCTALPTTGDTCMPATQEATCAKIGDICSQTTMTCVAVGLSGDPCTTRADCSPIYTCGASAMCVLGPRVGEACPTGDCIDNSFCNDAGMCQAPQADGASCTSNSECIGDCDDLSGLCATDPVCI